jgi:uncharacterized protein YndB with AHSA1/START domain
MSDEAVQAKTGRGWDAWFERLDAAGAKALDHTAIARLLVDDHQVDGWWAQSITVEYEKARGLRVPGQNGAGEFYASGSKTIAASVERVFAAFEQEAERAAWLQGLDLRVRTATAPKSIRFDGPDGRTRVAVHLVAKGEGKAQVSLQHEKLADAAEAERQKAYWREALDRLKARLEA